MRCLTVLLVAPAVIAIAICARAAETIRLAQTSTVTDCMMRCNSQSASCQSACVVPGTPPTASATTTSNATASSTCLLTCSSTLLQCQTACAQLSPSR